MAAEHGVAGHGVAEYEAAEQGAATGPSGSGGRRAAVLGKPVAHSKSPLLHAAAYRALGLTDWTYERIECDADTLPGFVDSLNAQWVGLSVTMPGKFAALARADERTARAELVGAANTLVRTQEGWLADCTDIDGATAAMDELGVPAGIPAGAAPPVVLGAGGTARPVLAALADRGAARVVIAVRAPARAAGAATCAERAGLSVSVVQLGTAGFADACADAPVTVSTLPGNSAGAYAAALAHSSRFLDVTYDPWPTTAARAVDSAGGAVIGGLAMLLGQAYGQVELFTGRRAPRTAMAEALR